MKCVVLMLAAIACAALASGASMQAAIVPTGEVVPVYAGGDPWFVGVLTVGRDAPGALQVDGGSRVLSATGRIGSRATGVGTMTVTGAGSQWDADRDPVYIGDAGSGTLIIADGGLVTSGDAWLAEDPGSDGTVTVTGPDTQWMIDGLMQVGGQGSGRLTIEDGALVSNDEDAYVGRYRDSNSVVIVTGIGSQWRDSDEVFIGTFGSGTLRIEAGGVVNHGRVALADSDEGTGAVVVAGVGSKWHIGIDLDIGLYGAGSLSIEAGGAVNVAGDSYLAHRDGSSSRPSGSARVTGVGSAWNNIGDLFVGYEGTAELVVDAGGVVNSDSVSVARTGGSIGAVTVSGAGSRINSQWLGVGSLGAGALTIEAGGVVHNSVSADIDSDGAAITSQAAVTGAGSQWMIDGEMSVGYRGRGELKVEAAGVVSSGGDAVVGGDPTANGTAHIAGSGSRWDIGGALRVGWNGMGTVTIDSGGVLTTTGRSYIGLGPQAVGAVTVAGSGSRWMTDGLDVGFRGRAELTVEAGGVVDNLGDVVIVESSLFAGTGTVTVKGAGSRLDNMGDLTIGDGVDPVGAGLIVENAGVVGNRDGFVRPDGAATVTGNGSRWENRGQLHIDGAVTVEDGGVVSSGDGYVGEFWIFNQTSETTISGAGARWENAGDLFVGWEGQGALTIEDAGAVNTTGDAWLGYASSRSVGTVTVTGPGSTWLVGGNLVVGRHRDGTLTIDDGAVVRVDGDVTFAENVLSESEINLLGGVLDLTGGELRIGSGARSDFNFLGGTLQNAGSIDLGAAFVQSAGTLAAGASPGATNIAGDYALVDLGILEVELAGGDAKPGVIDLNGDEGINFDFYSVDGDAILAGLVEAAVIEGFHPNFGQTFDVLTAATIDATDLSVSGPFDFQIVPGGNGQILQLVATVPEPATLAVVLFGGLCLLRRR